jgi:hypothetical protein
LDFRRAGRRNNQKNTGAAVVGPEPRWQAPGCCGDPGARGKFGPGSPQDRQPLIRARIAKGTIVHADEAASRANRHERFAITRINHPQTYSLYGAGADMAEEHVDLRRAAIGIHRHIAGECLLRSAQGRARRENKRRIRSRDQIDRITA